MDPSYITGVFKSRGTVYRVAFICHILLVSLGIRLKTRQGGIAIGRKKCAHIPSWLKLKLVKAKPPDEGCHHMALMPRRPLLILTATLSAFRT